MTTRYCGIGGNDGNSGLTWALRKLTLNGVEDTPVVAGDVVYVGPGVYRELLTVDVNGGAANHIVYIGDVTGEHTDQVGGIVRITGTDNDQTDARANCITATTKTHRTFRGFMLDTARPFNAISDCTNWIIEDCVMTGDNSIIYVTGDAQASFTVRRCLFFGKHASCFFSSTGIQNAGHLVENCIAVGYNNQLVASDDVGGIAVRNCLALGTLRLVAVIDALPGGFTAITVENCIAAGCHIALNAKALGEIVEDYNTFYDNALDRTNVNVGANSQTYPPLFLPPILHAGVSQISGFKFPWWFGELSEWSQIRAITGSNEPTEDLHGLARPVTASKNSWGPLQFADMERETGTTRGASTASLCLHDAGRHQIFVPVANESTTISVYVYREANYAGNNPQMICKQPGQADDVTTDAAAASQWNLLTTTFTPAADPPYVIVELVSRNTNGANDKVFFDDLAVS